MDYVWSAVIGVLASLAASGLTLLAYRRVRPKIAISPRIAKMKTRSETYYEIKIINRCRVELLNVKVELSLQVPKNVSDGTILATEVIPITRENVLHPEIWVFSRFDPADKDHEYAYRFTIWVDLEAKWKDRPEATKLVFRVYAEHPVSGLGRLFTQVYHNKRSDIVSGSFAAGDTFDIRPTS